MDEQPPNAEDEGRPADRDPHSALNNPVVDDPDLTEYPDPYEQRPDPKAPVEPGQEPPDVPAGAHSDSDPHPDADIEAEPTQPPERDRLDD